MGLKETQSLFVRLCVDAEFREARFSEEGTEDAGAFAPLEKEVRRQARSLISKRLGAVKEMLSATKDALGQAFAEEFRNFAATTEEPKGVNRHRLDTLAFAERLMNSVRTGLLPAPLLDLLTHETTPVRMWTERTSRAFRLHKYPPRRLLQLSRAGELPAPLPRRPCLLLWREGRGKQRGYFWREVSPWP